MLRFKVGFWIFAKSSGCVYCSELARYGIRPIQGSVIPATFPDFNVPKGAFVKGLGMAETLFNRHP